MEEYDLYHATNSKDANDIIKTQKFIIPADDENKKLLGEGAYYYECKQDAIEWNSREVNKNSKNIFPSYKEIKDRYAIIKSEIQLEKSEILNLDIREHIIKFKQLVNEIKYALREIDNYNDKNELGTVINFLYKNKRVSRKMIIKTIPYKIPNCYGIKIYKKVYCIKNTEIILCYELSTPIDWNEYDKIKDLYS